MLLGIFGPGEKLIGCPDREYSGLAQRMLIQQSLEGRVRIPFLLGPAGISANNVERVTADLLPAGFGVFREMDCERHRGAEDATWHAPMAGAFGAVQGREFGMHRRETKVKAGGAARRGGNGTADEQDLLGSLDRQRSHEDLA